LYRPANFADGGERRLKPFLEYSLASAAVNGVLGREMPLRPKSRPVFAYPTNLNPTVAKW
jgi:hypothetical protein